MFGRLLGDEVEEGGKHLAEVVYGVNHGIVTTFAVATVLPTM